jgi:hypothetical protein
MIPYSEKEIEIIEGNTLPIEGIGYTAVAQGRPKG